MRASAEGHSMTTTRELILVAVQMGLHGHISHPYTWSTTT